MKPAFALVLALFVFCSCTEDTRILENPDYFQLRMVSDATAKGAPEYLITTSGETIQFHDEALLDLSHVKSVEWLQLENRDGFDVWLELKDGAAKKFSEITRENIGRRVAVLIDDMVVLAPMIQAQVNNGKVLIAVDLPEEAAKSQAKEIREQLGRYAHPEQIDLVWWF